MAEDFGALVGAFSDVLRRAKARQDDDNSFEFKGSLLETPFVAHYIPAKHFSGRVLIEGLELAVDEDGLKDGLLIVSQLDNECARPDSFARSPQSELEDDSLHNKSVLNIPSLKLRKETTVYCGTPINVVIPVSHGQHVFHPGEKAEETTHIELQHLLSVKSKHGRSIISAYTEAVHNLTVHRTNPTVVLPDGFPTLLVKCDGAVPQNIKWMVEHLVLERETSNLLTKCVTITSPRSDAQDIYTSIFKKSNHVKSPAHSKVTSYTHSEYEMMNVTADEEDASQDGNRLSAEFLLSETSQPLMPLSPSANALLKVRVVPGSQGSVLKPVFNELSALDSLASIVYTGENNWTGLLNPTRRQSSCRDLLEEFIAQSMMPSQTHLDPVDPADQSMSESAATYALLDVFKRQKLDFADRFWMFLNKNMNSVQDVIYCIKTVVDKTVAGVLQPAIYHANQSTFARMVKEFYKASVAGTTSVAVENFDAYLSNPLQLVSLACGIGIEKVKMDYLTYFTTQELATERQFAAFLKPDQSLQEQISNLWKLHLCLEVVSLAKTYVNLTADSLRTLLEAAILFCISHDVAMDSPTFILSIPAFSTSLSILHSCCVDATPTSWTTTRALYPARGRSSLPKEITQLILKQGNDGDVTADDECTTTKSMHHCEIARSYGSCMVLRNQ